MGEEKRKKRFVYSILVLIFITLSGGFQDAYAYFFRDNVFANAQTGNVVFMSVYLVEGDAKNFMRYLVPVIFFVLGAMTARGFEIKGAVKNTHKWRQIVLVFEALVLFLVGFIPTKHDNLANASVSFVAAMQLVSFKSIRGHHFASTMCIGNMVKGASALATGMSTDNKKAFYDALFYFGVIALFGVGASLGYVATLHLKEYSIWISSVFLILATIFLHEGFDE